MRINRAMVSLICWKRNYSRAHEVAHWHIGKRNNRSGHGLRIVSAYSTELAKSFEPWSTPVQHSFKARFLYSSGLGGSTCHSIGLMGHFRTTKLSFDESTSMERYLC